MSCLDLIFPQAGGEISRGEDVIIHVAEVYVQQKLKSPTDRQQAIVCFNNFIVPYREDMSVDKGDDSIKLKISKSDLKSMKYFEALLNSRMVEAQNNRTDMSRQPLFDFLHLYHHICEALPINDCELCCMAGKELLFSLLETALYLQDDEIIDKALEYLEVHMSRDLCLDCWIFSYTHSISSLYSLSFKYCLYYGDYILTEAVGTLVSVQNLYPELVLHFIEHDHFQITTSKAVTNLKQKLKYTGQVSHDKKLSNRVKAVKVDIKCDGADAPHRLCVADASDHEILFSLDLPCKGNNRGDQLIGYSVCATGHMLYVSGGEFGLGRGAWNMKIFEIDLLSKALRRSLSMPAKRRCHMLCSSLKALYLCFGVDGYRIKRNEIYRIDLAKGDSSKMCSYNDEALDVDVDEADNLLFLKNEEFVESRSIGGSTGWQRAKLDDLKRTKFSLDSDSDGDDDGDEFIANRNKIVKIIWYPDMQLPKLT